MVSHFHKEAHKGERTGWLRASVLGANDGIISIASLVVGVAAAGAPRGSILLTGVAGLAAGAMSMAAGEYVSVQTQADTEEADLETEKRELESYPARELAELTAVYLKRGLDHALAHQVAETLTAIDPLAAHARDELGITETFRARPIQAAFASAISFAAGGIIPVAAALLAPSARVGEISSATALATLVVLGGAAAYGGGAPIGRGAIRVAFWGALAMGVTAGIGRLFGAAL